MVLDAVESVLATAGTPLSNPEIADRILKTGLWRTTGKTPQATSGYAVHLTMSSRSLTRQGLQIDHA
jgi:hypothetical protein